MKRITIGSVAPVLALLLAVASAGCLGQTGSVADGTDESAILAKRAHDVASGDPQAPAYSGNPAQTLELDVHTTGEAQGPHPEPWLDQSGPHPEPWSGRAISIGADPDPNSNNGKKP